LSEEQLKQRLVNQQIQPHVPEHAWDSTVAIVIVHDNAVHQFGTGILFRIAESSFVITAAHVVTKAHEHEKTIGITAAKKSLIALKGDTICSASEQYGCAGDPFDVAVHPLSADSVRRLAGKRFLRHHDIDFSEPSPTGVYSIFGFPTVWSRSASGTSDSLELKPMQYTTYAYDRETDEFDEFQPRFHLLLEGRDDFVTLTDGSSAEFKSIDGQPASFPGDLGGISGCSVWHIGDLKIPIGQWGKLTPRIVAVQTSVYRKNKAIKGTRWVAVTTLISEAFPELRPAINLWRER
jgi:hypothetical protein